MRSTIKQFMALAKATTLEVVRQPATLLLMTTGVLLIGLMPLFFVYQFGEEGKLVRDSSLAVYFIIGLFIAGYASSSAFIKELRKGTALIILSKPVSRGLFFLSKFAGVVVVLVFFSILMAIATLLAVKSCSETYVTDWVAVATLLSAPVCAYFVGGVLDRWTRQSFIAMASGLMLLFLSIALIICAFNSGWASFDWRIIPAGLLVLCSLSVISAIALGFATRVGRVGTLVLTLVVFAVGMLSDYFALQSVLWSKTMYWAVPNWQHFWVADTLTNGGVIPSGYVLYALLYALLYLGAVLCFGVLSFRNCEIK